MREPPKPAIRAAQRRLLLDVATAEVMHGLGRRGVGAILMKGPCLATWLYDSPGERDYADVDVLIDPGRWRDAESVLLELGFNLSRDTFADEWDPDRHANYWERDGVNVDLHWRIVGISTDPRRAWQQLSSATERVNVAGIEVEALGIPARALQLALHAAQHGVKVPQPMADLARGVARLPEGCWREAATLASQLDARERMSVGLRLLPEGRSLAERLGLSSEVSTPSALASQTTPPWSWRLYAISTAPGIGQKARRLAQGLVPPASYVRLQFPWARTGGLALVLAYVIRLVAGVRHLPGAIRALSRARRQAFSSKDTSGARS